ncbi:MAG: hypothetical protein RIE58_00555 [Vicingaceae bacterium]
MNIRINSAVALFFALNLLISSFYLDNWFNPNSLSRAMSVYSLVQEGTLQIDEFHGLTNDKCFVDGHYYSEKAPLPALFMAPFYFSLNKLIDLPDDAETHFRTILIMSSFLCGSIPFTIAITLLFATLINSMYISKAFILSTLPFYGSLIFIFTGTFFSHVFSGVHLLLAYLLLKNSKYFYLAGWLCGIAFLSEFQTAVIPAIWTILIIYRTKSIKNSLKFVLGILPSVIFILFFNFYITGSPLTMLYTYVDEMKPMYGLGLPSLMVVWDLIFSQFRGLLFYIPVFITFAYVLIREKTIEKSSFYSNYLIVPCLVYFLVFSSYHDWWGGWSYGPRQLIPIALLLTYEGILYLSRKKIPTPLLALCLLMGMVMALMAKTTVMYSLPTKFQWPFFEIIITKLNDGVFNRGNLLTYIFDIRPSISILMWMLLLIISFLIMTRFEKRVPVIK